MEALLKASEASALMGLSVRHVQRMAKSGELPYQTHMNERNRPEYLFPLSSLPDAAQQKYFAEHAPAALPAAAPAQAKKAMLNNPKHMILEAPHPSPLSAYRGFFGSRPFSKTNDFLREHGLEPIDWQIENIEK